jgi:IS5 family transposase
MSITAEFFRNCLDQMIDLRHPLAVLANRRPQQEMAASLAHLFARQVSAGIWRWRDNEFLSHY